MGGSYQLLLTEFDERTAIELAPAASPEEIQRQIDWLPYRNPGKNPQGLLRQAIVGDWSEPPGVQEQKQQAVASQRLERKATEQAKIGADAARRRQDRVKHRETLAKHWQALGKEDWQKYRRRAVEEATTAVARSRLRRSDLNHPPLEILSVMAADRAIPIGEPS